MYTLLQIIILLNNTSDPQVNLITSFKTLESCEKKIFEAKDRYKNSNFKIEVKEIYDNNKYLKITNNEKKVISYYYCKKNIF